MTINETKEMVNAILDMNDNGNFTYAPEVTIWDGGIIVSCMIHSKRTGDAKNVQDYNGNIFRGIDEAINDLAVNETKFIAQRIAELKKLEGLL